MCTNNNCPDFFFDHSAPPLLYASPDIIASGAGDTITAGGVPPTTNVRVHNSGQAGKATVALYLSSPGTGVLLNAAHRLGEVTTLADVPKCEGKLDGTISGAKESPFDAVSIDWNPLTYFDAAPGKTVHVCLFAQVRFDSPFIGCSATTSYPATPNPNLAANAQHNIDIVGVKAKMLRRNGGMAFGFAAINPFSKPINSRLVARIVTLQDPQYAVLVSRGLLAKLIKEDFTLQESADIGIALGKERIVVPVRADVSKALRSVPRLGHTGEVDGKTFEQLRTTELAKGQQVDLMPHEMHQAFVRISVPETSTQRQMFAVDIRHEDLDGKVVGGLVVILRIL